MYDVSEKGSDANCRLFLANSRSASLLFPGLVHWQHSHTCSPEEPVKVHTSLPQAPTPSSSCGCDAACKRSLRQRFAGLEKRGEGCSQRDSTGFHSCGGTTNFGSGRKASVTTSSFWLYLHTHAPTPTFKNTSPPASISPSDCGVKCPAGLHRW